MSLTSHQKLLFYVAFLLSGFCALVYEILWTKYLSLTFGTTILAASIVAATFMAGLAIGSYALGRYADRDVNLLRLYAFLEAGITLTALLFAPTLSIVEYIYVGLTQTFPDWPGLLHGLNFFFSAILLLPPTIFMGGTFPLICRYSARRKSGGQIGRLYALNTAGAMAGAFCAGFLLIPTFGLTATGYLAAILNLLIAAVAFWLSFNSNQTLIKPPVKRFLQPLRHHTILISVGFIGFFSLAYEILWTRVFLLFLGNTSYAFSLMLSAYLIGIALGGVFYSKLVHPKMNEKQLFILLTTLMGTAILATVPFYDQLAKAFLVAHQLTGERWWLLTACSFLIIFLVMAIPTILSGALLPTAVAILDPGKAHTGEGVGLVVLHNTIGAVCGSLVAGFVLIPLLGTFDSFRLLALINLALAIYLFWYFSRQTKIGLMVVALVVIGLIFSFTPLNWNEKLMNSGVYCYATKYLRMGGIDKVLEKEKVLEVIEGTDTTVAVHESLNGQLRFFTVNGKTDGGTGQDMSTQTLVGQLPMLMHPHPEEVLVIGLGTGITLRGLSAHPTDRIDCVELSPGVVKAAGYFTEANGNALDDPKINLIIRDGRNLLMTQSKKYDVIISEPSNPWQAGNANLFTADFYQLAAAHLKENGLFCQWIGLYDITTGNLRTLTRTFMQTFPRVLAFKAGSDMVLVGAQHELVLDYQQLKQRFVRPAIDQVLARVNIGDPGELIAGHYLFSERALKEFSGTGNYNTDDHSLLEYSARFNLGEKTLGEYQSNNMTALLEAQKKVFIPLVNLGGSPPQVAEVFRELAKGYEKNGRRAEAVHFMRKAAQLHNPPSG
ncbi:fused MFS/spermidine synthase [Malonomonas rubra]|uniref:fused MFS/spermidine synthase n=1 Tax=Malonomonas rubra TaxID=57040 RepID=UPI0026E9482B|nr:fused MFS/spermidine synthase [Malonomonas rubra]